LPHYFILTEEVNGDEEHLKSLVYNYGPVVVVIYASDDFTQYAGGVFSEPNCPNDLNRSAMLICSHILVLKYLSF